MNRTWLVVFLTSLVRGKRIVENTSVVSSLGDSVLLLCPTAPLHQDVVPPVHGQDQLTSAAPPWPQKCVELAYI